jgi:molybdopterin/thiamine biosynthesis adenylyltransferase
MGPSHPIAIPNASRPAELLAESQETAVTDRIAEVGDPRSWLEWHDWPQQLDPQGSDMADALRLKGVPESAAVLRDRTAVVLGLGAVGAIAFCELARAGVGTLIGVDVDRYGPESWVTQPIRRGIDVGRSKAELQGGRAHAINPAVHVISARGLAQHLPLWVFRRADLILVAADNLEVLVWVGMRAAALSKRLMQGAVQGESWLAIVRSFDLSDQSHPCPACGFGQREWSMLRSRVGCDPNTLREQGLEPTRTLTCVCGTAAHLLVGEALKWLFAIEGRSLAGEELAYCLLSHKVWRTRFTRNPDCRCPHIRWDLVDIRASLDEVTLGTLIDQSLPGPTPHVQGELPWVSFTVCPNCDRYPIPVRRFGRPGETLGRCRCGEPLVACPIGIRSVVPWEDLRHCRDLPLSQLGFQAGFAIGVSVHDQWTYFFVGDPEVPTIPHSVARKPKEQERPCPPKRSLSDP